MAPQHLSVRAHSPLSHANPRAAAAAAARSLHTRGNERGRPRALSGTSSGFWLRSAYTMPWNTCAEPSSEAEANSG